MLVTETVTRRRLAGRVRQLASSERDHGHRAGVIEFDAMHQRLELYEELARRIRDRRVALRPQALDALEQLLREEPPMRDYGLRARERNARIERILNGLVAPS